MQSAEDCLVVLNYETHLFVCEIICCTLQPNSRVTVLQGTTLCQRQTLQSYHESDGRWGVGLEGACRQGLCLPAVFGKCLCQ